MSLRKFMGLLIGLPAILICAPILIMFYLARRQNVEYIKKEKLEKIGPKDLMTNLQEIHGVPVEDVPKNKGFRHWLYMNWPPKFSELSKAFKKA